MRAKPMRETDAEVTTMAFSNMAVASTSPFSPLLSSFSFFFFLCNERTRVKASGLSAPGCLRVAFALHVLLQVAYPAVVPVSV